MNILSELKDEDYAIVSEMSEQNLENENYKAQLLRGHNN